METANLIFNTFMAMFSALSIFIVILSIFAYVFYVIWVYLPTKKVVVYIRDENKKVIKIKIEEKYADLLWGDKERQETNILSSFY